MNLNLYKDYKLSKLKLINKLKRFSKGLKRAATDENAFISINDFLAEEHSLGPKADPGSIDYYYATYENVNRYIKIFIKDIKYENILCIPDLIITSKKYITRNTIIYNITYDYLIINEEMSSKINKCKSKRFIYILLGIENDFSESGHSNIIIIDNFKKTIERFEPYGHTYITENSSKMIKNIDNKFNSLLKILNLNDYKYLSPIDISPKIGLQIKADFYDGMCSIYSLIYLQLRLMNPDIDQIVIINYLKSKEKNNILDIILKYTRYVEKILKENEDFILEDGLLLNNIESKKIYKFIIIDDNGSRIIER